MNPRRWAALGVGALALSASLVITAQSDNVTLTLDRATAQALYDQLDAQLGTSTTGTTTTPTVPPTTAPTTAPPTTAPPTTSPPTTAPPTTAPPTTSPPTTACVGVQVPAGANLVTIANAQPPGATFCLAAGIYNVTGSGMPLETGDSVIGAVGPAGARLSVLNGGMQATRALSCACSPTLIANIIVERFNSPFQSQPFGSSLTNTVWDNIESRFNNARGAYTWNGNVLRNSYIHHNGQLGIAGNGDDVLIEGNVVAFNNPDGANMPGGEGGGSKWTNAVNVTVRNNHFHDNCGNGIWFDGPGNRNLTITGNTSEDNWARGVSLEISSGPVVLTHNTIRRNAFGNTGAICQNTPGGESSGGGSGGIDIDDTPNAEVAFNIVEDNDGGIVAGDEDRASDPGLTNLNVHHNIIRWAVGSVGVTDTDPGSDPFTTAANNRWEANTYDYHGSSPTPFQWNGSKSWTQWLALGHDETGSFS